MAKAPDAFRTISEVAELLDTPAHVLRFWESKFVQVKPVKRAGGRRYYRPDDVALLGGIKGLLHEQGMTIKGAQKVLRDKGAKSVMEMWRSQDDTDEADDLADGDVIEAVANPPQDDAQASEVAPADDETPEIAAGPEDAVEDAPPPPDDVTPPAADSPPAQDEPAAAPDTPVAPETPAEPPRRGVSITMVSFVDDDTAQEAADTLPAPTLTNVVPLSPAPRDPPEPPKAPPPDLPPMPAPRPITGSRLLGTLARADRAAVAARGPALRPLVARLEEAYRRLTRP